jgi:hypothetical protein
LMNACRGCGVSAAEARSLVALLSASRLMDTAYRGGPRAPAAAEAAICAEERAAVSVSCHVASQARCGGTVDV